MAICELGELLKVKDNYRSAGYPKPSELTKTGIPFVKTADFSNHIVKCTADCISREKFEELPTKGKISKGSLLISAYGTIDVALFDMPEGQMSSGVKELCTDETKVDKKYLFYWLTKNITNMGSQSSLFKQLTIKEIENTKINLPNLKKQKQIIDIIEPISNSIDKQIESIETTILYLKNLKSYIENKGIEFIKKNGEEETFKKLLQEVSETTLEDNTLPLYSVGTKEISAKENDVTYKTSGHKVFALNELVCGLGVDEIHWNGKFRKGCISNAYSVYRPLKDNMSFYKYFLIPQLKEQKNLFTQNTNRRPEAIKKKLMKELKHIFYFSGDLSSYSDAINKCDELISSLDEQKCLFDDIKVSTLNVLIK